MNIKEISGKELENMKNGYTILDVREKDEYQSGHIKNAINLPLSHIMEGDFDLDKDKKYILHCRSNVRSKKAAVILYNSGYKNLFLAPGPALYDYDLVK